MIIDTSAILAILYDEADAPFYAQKIASCANPKISVGNYLESSIIIDAAKNQIASRAFDDLIKKGKIEIIAFDAGMAKIAREAYRDFGKASGSKAKLNFGDCFSYALAKTLDLPLLYKGDDFIHTDVKPV